MESSASATKPKRILAVDTETNGLSLRHGCLPFAVVIYGEEKILWYEWDVNPKNRTPIIPPEDVEDIKQVIAGSIVAMHNSKYDLLALELIGVNVPEIVGWENIHDTMLMSHANQSGGRHGLKELCVRHLGLLDDDEKRLSKIAKQARTVAKKLKWDIARPRHQTMPMVRKNSERSPLHKADMWLPRAVALHQNRPETDEWHTVLRDYALLDGKRTYDLFILLQKELEEQGLWEQYLKNQRLIKVTYEMERRGVSMRPAFVRSERMRFQKSARIYGAKAREAVRRPGINLRSTDQLREVLYGEYALPVLELTDKKLPSCSADTLAKLHPIAPPDAQELIENVIISRKFLKGLEYLEVFAGFLKGDRVHCNIRITGTSVTRMSVNDPPMQTVGKFLGGKEFWPDEINAALKTAGVNLRKCFGPAPGREWMAIDLQQAHPRLFAWLSKDEESQKVFNEGKDYYVYLASKALNLPPEKVSKAQRSLFKTLNLAQLYGSGSAKLEKVSGMDGIQQLLLDTFPTRALYIAKIQDSAGSTGYVTTAGGYRLYCPDAHKRVNYVILGTEGEVMKKALEDCHNYLEASTTSDYDPFVAMQIHDELLIDLPSGDRERNIETAKACASLMEKAALEHGAVIPAEITLIEEGKSWADGSKLEVAC